MKIFKIYSKIDEYIVLECPYCQKVFRSPSQKEIFGKKRENTKCHRCEKTINISDNSLDKDPIFKHWHGLDMIMFKPNGEQVHIERDKVSKNIGFKSADKIENE